MTKWDVAILTQEEYIGVEASSDYLHNIFTEEKLLADALDRCDLSSIRVGWSNKNFDWSSVQCAIFRSTWDYFERIEEFKMTVGEIKSKTVLINSFELFEWNINKRYLKNMADRGVNIVPTRYISETDNVSLESLFEEYDGNKLIMKPVVSATAFNTYKLDTDNVKDHSSLFNKLIKKDTMMLQPFQESITTMGEISYIVIGGEFTHAVKKLPDTGDFRVQDDFGGSVQAYQPTIDEISFAENVVKNCPEEPIYARVDAVRDNNGNMALMEIELIEPELWFRLNPEASMALAQSMESKVRN